MIEMNKLQRLSYNKYYIIVGVIMGAVAIISGIIQDNFLFIIVGIAVLGIQIIKFRTLMMLAKLNKEVTNDKENM